MAKIIVTFLSIFIFSTSLIAQAPPSKEQQDLERQRQQLKQDIEDTQELLNKNKKVTKENMGTLALINKKLGLQENVLDNINRDINLLDNTIYKSQRDINKMQLLLDTLKQDYAKSMVYSYKNRSNSDFLNFIFSASSFNDAIKRITYLKSYRNFREMQGENILRTQELLKGRINELSGNKKKKSAVLQTQSKEINVLQAQQEEKNDVVKKLKAQGKELNNQVAARKKQMQKVSNAIASAIKRAIADAKRESAAKDAEERKIKTAEVKASKNKKNNAGNDEADVATVISKVSGKASKKPVIIPVDRGSVLLNTNEAIALNSSFISNKGKLPWPVDKGYILLHFGPNKVVGNIEVNSPGITIASDVGTPVKVIFGGEVTMITYIDDAQTVTVKHGSFFTTYINLSDISVSKGQTLQTGQVIGKVAINFDGIGAMELWMDNDKIVDLNPELWLRRR